MIYSAMRRSWYKSRHRESIMALIPEIVKRLIQLGSVNLAKFILVRLKDLPSITALDLWTIGYQRNICCLFLTSGTKDNICKQWNARLWQFSVCPKESGEGEMNSRWAQSLNLSRWVKRMPFQPFYRRSRQLVQLQLNRAGADLFQVIGKKWIHTFLVWKWNWRLYMVLRFFECCVSWLHIDKAETAESKIKRFLSPYEALYFNFDALEFLHLAQVRSE